MKIKYKFTKEGVKWMLEEKSKNFINKLKVAIATNKGKDSKRKIESLVVFIIILIMNS